MPAEEAKALPLTSGNLQSWKNLGFLKVFKTLFKLYILYSAFGFSLPIMQSMLEMQLWHERGYTYLIKFLI